MDAIFDDEEDLDDEDSEYEDEIFEDLAGDYFQEICPEIFNYITGDDLVFFSEDTGANIEGFDILLNESNLLYNCDEGSPVDSDKGHVIRVFETKSGTPFVFEIDMGYMSITVRRKDVEEFLQFLM